MSLALSDVSQKNLPGLKTNSRLMSFRNAIGTAALANVQSYLTRFSLEQAEEYVGSAILYYGEVPFLYRVFERTNVRAKGEKGGYKVVSRCHTLQACTKFTLSQVRHGIFQQVMVIDTMLVYYGRKGTKSCIPTASVPGNNPIGVLTLVCAAVGPISHTFVTLSSCQSPQVEQALSMHSSGFLIKSRHSFSEKSCGPQTAIYLKLANDMTAAQWAGFYGKLRVHEGIQDSLEEDSKPAGQWTDDPDQYFIVGSDPLEEE